MASERDALPADALARIDAEFAGETYFEAVRQLEALALPTPVLRAVLHLSRGDLEELRRFARAAERDACQVVFWAEYEDHDAAEPRKVRSMREPLPAPPRRD